MAASSVLLDTNVLLEATTPARALHFPALEVLNAWPGRGVRLCLSGQILREYLVVATRDSEHNGLGLDLGDALANAAAFIERSTLLEEGADVAYRLQEVIVQVTCTGKQIHDANLVATALVHGVEGLVTANVQDLGRFDGLLEVIPLREGRS